MYSLAMLEQEINKYPKRNIQLLIDNSEHKSDRAG